VAGVSGVLTGWAGGCLPAFPCRARRCGWTAWSLCQERPARQATCWSHSRTGGGGVRPSRVGRDVKMLCRLLQVIITEHMSAELNMRCRNENMNLPEVCPHSSAR